MKSDNDTNVATKNIITEARELCEKATPGPWMGLRAAYEDCLLIKCDKDEYLMSQHDVAFIARSRTLIPELCDALEKAQADLMRYRGAERDGRLLVLPCNEALELEFAIDLIPELCDALEKYRWIPVTERLPTGCGYYLSVVERIAPDELGGNNTRVKIMRWTGEDWRYSVHIPEWINEAITETVTHWMPLPAAPEKGAERERD